MQLECSMPSSQQLGYGDAKSIVTQVHQDIIGTFDGIEYSCHTRRSSSSLDSIGELGQLSACKTQSCSIRTMNSTST